MDTLNRFGTCRNPHTLRAWFAGGLVVVGFSTCLHSDVLHAAPITLRFEGTIGPPRDGTFPIDLPFSFAEGDPISGSFKLEPIDVTSGVQLTELLQSGMLTLNVDFAQLQSEHYSIQVVDNLTSDEDPIPADRIRLSCSSFIAQPSCNPTHIPGSTTVDWAFGITLNGAGGVLNGADVPGDVAAWRQFLPGDLLVTFRDTLTGRTNGFIATIESIEIVPEPGSFMLILLSCGGFGLFVRHPAKS
jgi:hypothetical protein